MANLFEAAKNYQKKDIFSLPELNLKELEIKEDTFGEGASKRKYSYFEKDGWKYTLKAEVMSAIKEVIENRPTTTKVKVYKNEKGEVRCMPLD